ncbi:MAG: serine protease [Chloracidobacterium sp.]|nr:serine protease [Chloracidobacterium sp.]
MNVGDQIIVLGNPLALEELEVTISTGILSGIRTLSNDTQVLQITAAISPGNSGGPYCRNLEMYSESFLLRSQRANR